jgi:hypothetical protein
VATIKTQKKSSDIHPVLSGFTTTRLRDIAQNNPQLIWGNTAPPPVGSGPWNGDVGRFFQDAVLQAIGLPENHMDFVSGERQNQLGYQKDVRPDALEDVVVLKPQQPPNPPQVIPYLQSGFIEVKAVSKPITLSYESWQLTGFIDASRSQQTAFGNNEDAGIVSYITTSNTLIGTFTPGSPTTNYFAILSAATTRRVALCYAVVWEIADPSQPYNPQIVVGLNAFLNPEVNTIVAPLEFQGCPNYSQNPIRLSSVNNPPPDPTDPDPLVFDP